MNERLLQFLAAENISQSQFAETIGVARASVSHIIAGRNKPGYEFICSILERYPSLNPEWMLLGKGKMYKGAVEKGPQPSVSESPAMVLPVQDKPESDILEVFASEPEQKNEVVTEQDFSVQKEPVDVKEEEIPVRGRRRSVSKIIVFYDDDTFQELKG